MNRPVITRDRARYLVGHAGRRSEKFRLKYVGCGMVIRWRKRRDGRGRMEEEKEEILNVVVCCVSNKQAHVKSESNFTVRLDCVERVV